MVSIVFGIFGSTLVLTYLHELLTVINFQPLPLLANMGAFGQMGFRVGYWPIPKAPNSHSDKTHQKDPQLWVDPAFGKKGFYSDCQEFVVILKNLTKLVSQQVVFVDKKKLPFRHTMNPVVMKMMDSQKDLGAAQLDGRSFVSKANFMIHNYCSLLSLMITTNAFFLPSTIPFKVLKVNEESQHWEWIFGSESVEIEKGSPTFDPKIHDPLLNAMMNHTPVKLDSKGMKNTLANISYIGFKKDYYYNLEIVYSALGNEDGPGEVDNMELFDLKSSESNPTPRTAFCRIKGIGDRILEGVYDSYPEFVKNGRKGLMVNEFLVYWPLVSGYLIHRTNRTNFVSCLKGSSQKTLKALMNSLEIKAYNDGGHFPVSKAGNPTLRSLSSMFN